MVERLKENRALRGARQVLKCLGLNANDRLLIIADKATLDVSRLIHAQALNSEIVVLEDMATRPITAFPVRLADKLSEATATVLCSAGQVGELATFRRPLIELVKKRKIRHAHMIGVNMRIMREGMSVDYGEVRALSAKVYAILSKAREVRVTTVKGTDFLARFEGQPWIISDGTITSEKWSNLPDGEVWTAPSVVEGTIIVDGVLGDSLAKYGLLRKNPLILKIKDSRVIDIGCAKIELISDFVQYIKQDENAARIGEFALGTNTGIKKLIGTMLQDEKYPGVHIAVGNPYPELTGARWKSKAHCDAVLIRPTVDVDGKRIMDKGNYVF
jgi:leucyl aminopeptidase (aminopeptidase T)